MANFLQRNPEMSELPTAKEYEARITALEAELTQAHADNAKLETLWENAVAARDKLSEELTQARAERDDAREALEKEADELAEAAVDGVNALAPIFNGSLLEYKGEDGEFIGIKAKITNIGRAIKARDRIAIALADLADARAAIKAEGE